MMVSGFNAIGPDKPYIPMTEMSEDEAAEYKSASEKIERIRQLIRELGLKPEELITNLRILEGIHTEDGVSSVTTEPADDPYALYSRMEERASDESKETPEQALGRAMERMEEIDHQIKKLGEDRRMEEKTAIQAREKLLKMCEAATRFFREKQAVPPPDHWG